MEHNVCYTIIHYIYKVSRMDMSRLKEFWMRTLINVSFPFGKIHQERGRESIIWKLIQLFLHSIAQNFGRRHLSVEIIWYPNVVSTLYIKLWIKRVLQLNTDAKVNMGYFSSCILFRSRQNIYINPQRTTLQILFGETTTCLSYLKFINCIKIYCAYLNT